MSDTILPAVVLQIPGSTWPPAADGRVAGTAEVASWSWEREIVGSSLPGNIRTRTGLSVGSGSVELPQVDGLPLAPWVKDPSRRVRTGQSAKLYAETIPAQALGSWVTREVSGSLTSSSVPVGLIEAQGPGKRGRNELRPGVATDPGVVVAALATECGFHAVPPPVASAVWALPVSYGTDQPAIGLPVVLDSTAQDWSTASGALGTSGLSVLTDANAWPSTFFLTLNALGGIGWVRLTLGDFAESGVWVAMAPWVRTLEVRIGSGTAVQVTWPAGSPDASWPNRIQVEVQCTRSSSGTWTGVQARARASRVSAWSSWATASGTTTTPAAWCGITSDTPSVSGIQITTNADDPALYAAPTALIEPLGRGATIQRWVPYDLAPWDTIQTIMSGIIGAGWVDRFGRFTCRGRDYLAGTGSISQSIDVAARVEDLGWSIDPADAADRLELTYTPGGALAQRTGEATTIWTAQEAIHLPANEWVSVEIPLTGPCSPVETWDHASFVPSGSNVDTWPHTILSAMTALTGGTAVNLLLIDFRIRRASAGLAVAQIRQRSTGSAWLVDANDAPCLIVKATNVVSFDSTQTVVRGIEAADSQNAISVELGPWAQSLSVVTEIADYLWGRVAEPAWKATSVRVVLDWTLDIGQIVTLTHADSTLSAKALITKVAYSGSPGEIAQTIDVVLLPPTWAEFDAAWSAKTWTNFDTAWSAKAWTDFDTDPLRTS